MYDRLSRLAINIKQNQWLVYQRQNILAVSMRQTCDNVWEAKQINYKAQMCKTERVRQAGHYLAFCNIIKTLVEQYITGLCFWTSLVSF